MLNYNLYIKD